MAPGSLDRDLSGVVRRHPKTEAVVLARSEASLLREENIPVTSLPEKENRKPTLVTFSWESPGMKETEAAELALEDLIRSQMHETPERSPYPTVNLFGPPIFGPGAAAEYAEAERLLDLIGVEVNARAPLGADARDLGRLPRAWANVLLYREVGESATLFLQDEFGMPRVTTPMIGAAGTGAALRALGELCQLDPKSVQRTIWAELARTAKLPWYARLEPPETFRNRKVAIFGDFTYPLGLGYALAREVGLEVVACGTYLTHLERDFLFHAHTFTEGAFVEEDPEAVAARIEAAEPDLIVGTYLEEGVADSLGVPFLPLCPPAAERPLRRATAHGLRRIERPRRRPRQRPEVENQGTRRRSRHQVDRRGAAGGCQCAAVPAGPGQAARRGPCPTEGLGRGDARDLPGVPVLNRYNPAPWASGTSYSTSRNTRSG